MSGSQGNPGSKEYPICLFSLFFPFLFDIASQGVWDLFPNQGWNLAPLHWKREILTGTGPPGRSMPTFFIIQTRGLSLEGGLSSGCMQDKVKKALTEHDIFFKCYQKHGLSINNNNDNMNIIKYLICTVDFL